MQTIAGLTPTGRRLRGPASDLVELEAANGLRHTAILFHEEYSRHRALNDALEVVIGFLESPLVTGLAELTARDPSQCAFVYPTGQCWSVAEVVRSLADMGRAERNFRAALELMYAAGQILTEAAERGERDGVYSHGGLTPWRIMLKKDGQVEIIGYALPQVEILQFSEDSERIPTEDSFRYCPPERVEFAAENLTSDLFSLALIAFELMTGKPVYDGLVNDIRQQAARGEGTRRLFRFKDKLPPGVRELLTRSLRPEMDSRFESGEEFLAAVRALINSSEAVGPSLMDIMAQVSQQVSRSGAELVSTRTIMTTAEDLKSRFAAELGGEPAESKVRGAWSPVSRGRSGAAAQPAAAPEGDGPGLERLPVPPPPVEPPPAPPPVVASGHSPPEPAKPADPAARWSAPDTSRRRAAPRLAGAAAAAPAATPAAVPRPDPTPAPVEPAAGGGVVDLLARIQGKAAPDKASAHASARDLDRSQDADRVRSILGTSTTAAAAAATLPTPTPAASGHSPPPAPLPGGDPDAPRPPRRVRRQGLGDSGGDKTTLISQAISLSLANASAAQRQAEEEARQKAEEEARQKAEEEARQKAEAQKKAEEEARQKAEAQKKAEEAKQRAEAQKKAEEAKQKAEAQKKAEPVKAAETKPKPEAQTSKPAASAGRAGEGLGEASRVVPTQVAFPAGDLARAPDIIPSSAGKSGVATYSICRGPGGRTLRMRLPTDATTAEAVGLLLGNVVPVRTDLTGRITGWYRLSDGEIPLPADKRLGELDAERTYTLRFVPNGARFADITVQGGPVPVRLVAPVGTALPAVTIADHLAGWLGLPEGEWELSAGGVALQPYAILADLPESGGLLALLLARKGGR